MGNRNSTTIEIADGWSKPDQGTIPVARLEEWINEYFNTEEDLSKFERRNKGYYLELRHLGRSRGYVFTGPLQLDRDYEGRMQETKRLYKNEGKIIKFCFTDFDNNSAGFSWERS